MVYNKSMKDVDRNEALVLLRKAHDWTFERLGRAFHISRQKAHDIFKRAQQTNKED